jgi:hypothetical protein
MIRFNVGTKLYRATNGANSPHQHTPCMHLVPTDPNRLAAPANRSLAAIFFPGLRLRPGLRQRRRFPFRLALPARCRHRLAPWIDRPDRPKAASTAAPARRIEAHLGRRCLRRPWGAVGPARFPPRLVGCSARSPPPARFPAIAAESLQLPDPLSQNDEQYLTAQLRGELPPTLGAPALPYQALDSLARKILQLLLYRKTHKKLF